MSDADHPIDAGCRVIDPTSSPTTETEPVAEPADCPAGPGDRRRRSSSSAPHWSAPLVDRAIRGDERAQRALDLTLVETWEITDRTHTIVDVDLSAGPARGRCPRAVWLACGTYDEPVRDENAVHDLEHGTVWITHDPDLSDDDLAALAEQLPDNGIMSPREGLSSPVVVTVWGAQLRLDGADDQRLGLFLEEYGDGHTAPEFGVTCEGGTPDPTGALPEPGTNA